MSDHIDFIITDIKKIVKPEKEKHFMSKNVKKQEKKSGSFQIQKSFQSQSQTQLPSELRAQVEKLKKALKANSEKEKKIREMRAEGLLKKENEELEEMKNQIQNNEKKLTVNKDGHLTDEKGSLVFQKKNNHPTLIVNRAIQDKKKVKELQKIKQIKVYDKLAKSFKDPHLVMGTLKRRLKRSKHGLQFHEQGTYQPVISQEEDKEFSDLLKEDKQKKVKKKLTILKYNKDIPDLQWWDQQLVNQSVYSQYVKEKLFIQTEELVNSEKLSNEIIFQKVGEEKKEQKIVMPIFLTKDQRKKLKRKKKKQKLMQKNDMIKLGIIEADQPKLKIANMAVVMKNQFILDPSKVEAQAKKQVEERLKLHQLSNTQRKLTKSQKKQKNLRKLKRDSAKQCKRVVFKLNKLDEASHCFKLNKNAEQLALNGFLIKPNQYHRQPVIIAIEGGLKAVRFYKNLMMNRIKWSENENQCKIVWQGSIKNTNIGKWKQYSVGDQSQTLKILTEKKMQTFWEYI